MMFRVVPSPLLSVTIVIVSPVHVVAYKHGDGERGLKQLTGMVKQPASGNVRAKAENSLVRAVNTKAGTTNRVSKRKGKASIKRYPAESEWLSDLSYRRRRSRSVSSRRQ